MTNNRNSVFNQDLIPIILRTKLIPQLEENEMKSYVAAKEFENIKTYEVFIHNVYFLNTYLLKVNEFFLEKHQSV
jgi:hypothetical protein